MESGRRVAVVERNICGGTSTRKSAGFLTPDSELELAQLVRRYGTQGARDLWEAPVNGIRLISVATRKYGIDCDPVSEDSLFLGNGVTFGPFARHCRRYARPLKEGLHAEIPCARRDQRP